MSAQSFESTALRLREMGYHPIPVIGGECPVLDWEKVYIDAERIAKWGAEYPGADVAIRTDGLAAVEIDVPHRDWCQAIERSISSLLTRPGHPYSRTDLGFSMLYLVGLPEDGFQTCQFKLPTGERIQIRVASAGKFTVVRHRGDASSTGLLDTRREDLPAINMDELRGWVGEFVKSVTAARPAGSLPTADAQSVPSILVDNQPPPFCTAGPALLRRGFKPIPVNGKRPVTKAWVNAPMHPDQIGFWAEEFPRLNTGLRTEDLVAVDIDIYHHDVADAVEAAFVARFGPGLKRLGQVPKRLLLYGAKAPGLKITSPIYKTMDGMEHKVEILGDGQQFVAYGIHPDSRRPYQWVGDGPLDVERWQLNVLDRDEVAKWVLDDLDAILCVKGFTPKIGGSATTPSGAPLDPDDPFDRIKPRHDDVSLADLAWMLDHLEPELCDDRDSWRNAVFAVHHQFHGTEQEEEALDLVDAWSQKSVKYTAGCVHAIWNGAAEQRLGLTTMGTLKAWLGDAWKGYKRTAVTPEAVEQAADWASRIRKSDEALLMGPLAAEIREAKLTEIDRAALVKHYQNRLKELKGVTIPVVEVRKALAPVKPTYEDESSGLASQFESEPPLSSPFFLGPAWAKDWFWLISTDSFFNRKTKELCSIISFNAQYAWDKPSLLKREHDDYVEYSPFARMTKHWRVPVLDGLAYHPQAGEVFELGGLKLANTYRPDLCVKADTAFTEEGRRLVEALERHLSVLLPNVEERNIFRAWLAFNYRNPGVKIRWAPLLKGAEGDGKSIFGDVLQTLLGLDNVRTMSADTIQTSPFSGWATGQCVVVLEEVRFQGHNRYDIVNKLKPFITNNSVELHAKSKDPHNALNVSNYLLLTNHDDAIPLTDGDRRYFVLRTPYRNLQEFDAFLQAVFSISRTDHFNEIFELGNAHPGQLALWLEEVEYPEAFNPNGEAPRTKARALMIQSSASDVETLVHDILDDGAAAVRQGDAEKAVSALLDGLESVDALVLRKRAEGAAGAAGWPPVPKGVPLNRLAAYLAEQRKRFECTAVPGVGPDIVAFEYLKTELEKHSLRPPSSRSIGDALKRAGFQPLEGPKSRPGKARQVRWNGARPGIWVRGNLTDIQEPEVCAHLDLTAAFD